MGLVRVDSETITNAVSSVYLTGINDDSVYMCVVSNLSNADGNHQLRMRVASDSSQKTSGNYDYAYKLIRSDTTFDNGAVPNAAFMAATTTSTNAYSVQNYIMYFYNWYSSTEYSYWTLHEVAYDSGNRTIGQSGGGVYDVAESHNSVRFYTGQSVSNEYDSTQGTFTLYRVT